MKLNENSFFRQHFDDFCYMYDVFVVRIFARSLLSQVVT